MMHMADSVARLRREPAFAHDPARPRFNPNQMARRWMEALVKVAERYA